MSKQLFSPEQIEQLQKNPHVLKVSERTITYADAFKSKFIDEYLAGKTPR
ncbi:HTH domain-containing protein, partial [Ureibacillus endophyticus]